MQSKKRVKQLKTEALKHPSECHDDDDRKKWESSVRRPVNVVVARIIYFRRFFVAIHSTNNNTHAHTHYSPKKWLLDKHNDSLVSFIAYVFNFKHWKFHSHARVHTQVERLQVSPVNNSKPFYFLSFDATSVLFWVIIRLLNVNSVVFQSLSFNLTGRKKSGHKKSVELCDISLNWRK